MPRQAHLCITVDTECDGSRRSPRGVGKPRFRNIREGVAEGLQPMLNRHGACGTYFIDWLVLTDGTAMDTLLRMPGRIEIGAHLHPDHISRSGGDEPTGTGPALFGCSDIPDEQEKEKLAVLTDAIEERSGTRPTCFRAGRFGADAATLRALADLGYKVDSSVTPGISWVKKGGPDFRTAPRQPYWADAEDITRPGSGPILEIPVTVGGRKLPFLPDHWFLYDWLRPSNTSARRMIRLIERVIDEADGDRPLVFTMMFHSQELVGGASPYAPTERAASRLLGRIEAVVAHCKDRGIRFSGLGDVYAAFA